MYRNLVFCLVMICDAKGRKCTTEARPRNSHRGHESFPPFLLKVCRQTHWLHNLHEVKYVQQHIQI